MADPLASAALLVASTVGSAAGWQSRPAGGLLSDLDHLQLVAGSGGNLRI
jgi:hypothetical protein